MKTLLFCCIALFGYAFDQPSDITTEALLQDPGTNYIGCLQEVLKQTQPRTMLEFGLGFGTKPLLDSCKRVVSVEVITHGYGPDNLRKFIQFYRDYSNWIPIAFFSGYRGDMSWAPYKYLGSDAVYVACSYQCATNLSYEPIDPFYLKELGEFISNLVKFNKVEIALIHPILFLRGDLVELCFHKIPIIVAHDTASRYDVKLQDPWGYRRVKTPDDYEEILTSAYPGTTVWIEKKPELQQLIKALQ